MSSKLKIIVIGVVVLGGVVLVLLNNRMHLTAKAKTDEFSSPPVSVVQARRQKLAESLSLIGTITGNNDVAIVAETQGRVTAVLAQVGDFRAAGSPLMQIDDELKRAEYQKTEVNYERAKRDMERFKALRDQNAATDAQKETAWQNFKVSEAQLTVARRQLKDARITTPISGVVTARLVDVGTMVFDKMVVANVVDVATMKAKLNVAEQDAFKLKVGDRVDVTTDVYPGVTFTGKIYTISAKADEGHTYPVEIRLANSKDHPLKAGMFGRVSFVSIGNAEALSIPRDALVGSFKRPQVFVVRGSIAYLRNIVVGEEFGQNLSVLQGLAEGESVVINGQNNLKDSVAVAVLN